MGYGFHSHDGLFFDKDEDGNVIIRKVDIARDLRRERDKVLLEVTLDENTWASAVASVSARGEDADTFAAALRFHKGV